VYARPVLSIPRDLERHEICETQWRIQDPASQHTGKPVSSAVFNFSDNVLVYGVRSHHPYTRGTEGAMLAFNPQYRTTDDTKDYGTAEYLNAAEIDDVAEYVLQLGGQTFDAAKAARGKALFFNNAKGNCFDCHGEDATGIDTIGSTNLTKTRLYLYGSDRASIIESITKGQRGVMPGFEGTLKPEELKAVSVFVFFRAAKGPPPPG